MNTMTTPQMFRGGELKIDEESYDVIDRKGVWRTVGKLLKREPNMTYFSFEKMSFQDFQTNTESFRNPERWCNMFVFRKTKDTIELNNHIDTLTRRIVRDAVSEQLANKIIDTNYNKMDDYNKKAADVFRNEGTREAVKRMLTDEDGNPLSYAEMRWRYG